MGKQKDEKRRKKQKKAETAEAAAGKTSRKDFEKELRRLQPSCAACRSGSSRRRSASSWSSKAGMRRARAA